MQRTISRPITVLVLLVFISSLLTGCKGAGDEESYQTKPGDQVALAAEFAAYREVPVSDRACLLPYKAAADLSNISNRDRFQLSPEVKQRLVENGFVVIPSPGIEYFMLYEINRYDGIPNLVTTDAMLHNYHLFFDYLLKTVEQDKLLPELKALNQGMLAASEKQYKELKEGNWGNAARRNMAFFAVGSRLLDKQSSVPSAVKKEVEAELKLIDNQAGVAISPVMSIGQSSDELESLKEDYTQYIPRGHYTRSEGLRAYFQNLMWYGRMSFRLKNEDETRSAVLMSLALNENSNLAAWNKIYSTSSFFVGRSDDLGYEQYAPLLQKIYGTKVKLSRLISDKSKWQAFLKEAGKLKGPAINSIPIFDASIQPDRDLEIKGFRFMGQRYTVDADIFQRLIYREVGENTAGEKRVLPKGLDIPAAFGSTEAAAILKETGDYQYPNYPENMAKMQKYLSGLEANSWQQNLYWSWIYNLRPLTVEKPAGYPSFMLNSAWQRKELNTFLGSWTELKHDTILYAKQNYAEMGGGGLEVDDRGYVEPNPQVYARLASLTAMTREGLETRDMLNERDAESLRRMEKLALSLKTISEKELQEKGLSDAEYELIRSFGGQLEHFWLEALRDQGEKGRSQLLADNPAMVVADVATAPPDQVLEEATGFVQEILAVVPVEGNLRIARGAVYSYYEFPWPATDRLTDEKWREMVLEGNAPEPPAWTRSFVVEGNCRIILPGETQQ